MNSNSANTFSFKPFRILTQQFASVGENYIPDKEVQIRTTLEIAVDKENRVVIVTPQFVFETEKGPFLILHVASFFELSPEGWEQIPLDSEGKRILPIHFLQHLAVIAIGTSRGVLHTKTEGTNLNGFVLPSINVTELLTNDFHV